MINLAKRSQKILLVIILLNLVSTWFHYTDNALFVDQYPEPEWFTTVGIFATVTIMTPVGCLGYWLYTKRMFWLAYLFLGLYSITSVSSPGHYLFPAVTPMSAKMHGLIWLDAVSGVILISFIIWSGIMVQEWRNTQVVD